jgi:hypothetical protein
MSETCPNAKRVYVGRDPKTRTIKHRCDVICPLCKGRAVVEDCADCDGCGLRPGGIKCQTCQCYGKVPATLAVA